MAAKLFFVILISFSVYGWCYGRCVVPRLAGGRARPRQGGQLLKFTCQAGYQLVGNRYAYCRAGRWDVDLPVCVKPGCDPVVVENSIQVPLHDGAWVFFFCMPGYRHDGPSVIFCNGRTWNGTAPKCIVSAAPGKLGCDFESGLCGWAQDELHDFDWKRWAGRTPSAFMFTGPSHDHTHGPQGAGSYVYLEATSRLENDTARLLSPVYYSDLAKNGCFSFFYHMFGKTIGGLRVYQKPTSLELPALLALGGEARRRYLLFERWGDQGDTWYGAVADLNDFQENFQIVIEGIRGSSFTSDIAVDDVALLRGEQCAAARANAPTPPPYDAESCSGRCEGGGGVSGGTAVRHAGSCGCGAECLADDDCCPDYFDLCGFAVTDASSEHSLASEIDLDGGRLPDKQPLVASTASSRDGLRPRNITFTTLAVTKKTVPTTTTIKTVSSTTSTTETVPTTTTTSTVVIPLVVNKTRRTTISTKSFTNFTSTTKLASLSTMSTLRSTTKSIVNVPSGAVLPAFRRTATITTTIPSTSRSTWHPSTSRLQASSHKSPPASPSMPIQRPLPSQKSSHLKKQLNKGDSDSSSGGLSTLAVVACVLVALCVCVVGGWSAWRSSRSPRAPALLARLRARASHDPEVRFLTSNVDE